MQEEDLDKALDDRALNRKDSGEFNSSFDDDMHGSHRDFKNRMNNSQQPVDRHGKNDVAAFKKSRTHQEKQNKSAIGKEHPKIIDKANKKARSKISMDTPYDPHINQSINNINEDIRDQEKTAHV